MSHPTKEQLNARSMFAEGETMVIEAGAGTGKTTTLVMLGHDAKTERRPRRGQYIAFNKAIVVEAGDKLPSNVQARTAHSLAYGAMMKTPDGRALQRRLNSGRVRGDQIARHFRIQPYVIRYGEQSKVLQPGFLASLAQRAINVFCNTSDPAPNFRHVPYIDGIDAPTTEGRRTFANNDAVSEVIGAVLPAMWEDLTTPGGVVPFKHDHYLKAWELGLFGGPPFIDVDFVLFDEGQDASPVMLSIVEQQADHAQIVFVGDSQQGIYGWRGAVNALENALGQDNRTFLTQSFRFGPAIAEVANTVLEKLDADLRLVGTPDVESTVDRVSNPRCILTRTNALAVETVLQAQTAGRTPLLLGGGNGFLQFAKGAQELMTRGRTGFPDLACFDSWQQVLEYVQHDPQGDELALSVRLINEYGVDDIIAALSRMPKDEADCDLVVSTAHKAKGREWDTVQLGKDFTMRGEMGAEEWRLLYVACTRAKHTLDLFAAEPMRVLLGLDEGPDAVGLTPSA